jgi:hypothetical protein
MDWAGPWQAIHAGLPSAPAREEHWGGVKWTQKYDRLLWKEGGRGLNTVFIRFNDSIKSLDIAAASFDCWQTLRMNESV